MNKILLFLFSFLIWSCSPEQDNSITISPEEIGKNIVENVEIIYSDSAKVQIRVKSPRMEDYFDSNKSEQIFPIGINVDIFNKNQQITGNLIAKYAVRDMSAQKIKLQNDVVWKSNSGEILETQELIIDEKKEIFTSNRFVKITTKTDVIFGYGLEANFDFSEWTILAPEGNMGFPKD